MPNVKVKLFVLFFLLLAFVSCQKKNCFMYEVNEVSLETVPNVDIYGSVLPIDGESGDCIYCIDTFLVIHRNYGTKYYFDVYSANTYDSIMSFGLIGRSRNEFLSCPLNVSKQLYTRNGDVIIPLMDEFTCKEVNFTRTINKGSCVIDGSKDGVGYRDGSAVYYGDNYNKMMAFIEGVDKSYSEEEQLPMVLFIDEKGKAKQKHLYNRYMDNPSTSKASMFYSGVLFKQPEGNMVAQPINCMPYVFLYNLKSQRCRAIHIEGKRSFDEGVPDMDIHELLRCFMDDAVPLKDYILLFYCGDYESKEEIPEDYCGRILKMDWDGNIIKSYTIKNFFFRFGFDPVKEILYGADIFSGDFYSFDLSD